MHHVLYGSAVPPGKYHSAVGPCREPGLRAIKWKSPVKPNKIIELFSPAGDQSFVDNLINYVCNEFLATYNRLIIKANLNLFLGTSKY